MPSSDSETDYVPSAYEQKVKEKIKRNQDRLKALGLIRDVTPSPSQTPSKARVNGKKAGTESNHKLRSKTTDKQSHKKAKGVDTDAGTWDRVGGSSHESCTSNVGLYCSISIINRGSSPSPNHKKSQIPKRVRKLQLLPKHQNTHGRRSGQPSQKWLSADRSIATTPYCFTMHLPPKVLNGESAFVTA
jgi:hypothetical protein